MPQVYEDIIVDAEFAALIPPLSAEERQQLEENIVEHGGARDPLVVWVHETWTPEGCTEPLNYDDGVTERLGDGSGGSYIAWDGNDGDTYFKEDWPCTLLDGHNRYEICTRLELPFDVHELRFKSREEAEDWIDKNQLGRRNLDARQMSLLRGRRYNRTKLTPEQSGALQGEGSDKMSDPRSAASLAAEHGVNEKTIRRDGEFAEAVETLGIEREIVAGEIDAPKHEIVAAAKALPEQPTREQVAEAVEAVKSRPHVANNSGDNEWYTPKEYIEAARQVLGEIALDPASNPLANDIVQAATFYTAEDTGLDKDWLGTVWMNPPYESGLIGQFAEKLCDSYASGNVTSAVVLVNNATETRWFQSLAEQASAACFPKGRVKFWHPRKVAVPLQGQAILYLGPNTKEFARAFSQFGFCMEAF
jgi:ParB family chromosome partitioning protein